MNIIKKIYDKCRVEFRERIGNPMLGSYRRNLLINNNFTIVSNNCWGAHVYRYFNMPYDSPTIGLYFYAEDYVKFVYNFRYYIDQDLQFVSYKDSKHKTELERKNETNVPIGVLGDIEIVFLHYKSVEEAREKWNRRKERIHWDNLFFKMSEQNLCNIELLRRFDALSVEKKIVFVSTDYSLESQVIFDDYLGNGEVSNDTLNFRKYINIIKWLNGMLDFKR